MYVETDLSYNQKLDLLFVAADAYGNYDSDSRYHEDAAHEIVDNWVPWANHEIRQAWADAGCPEPEDFDLEAKGNIHARMQQGIYGAAQQYLLNVIREADNVGEAIDEIVKQRDMIENPADHWREIVDA
jgi:hypothetical protein